MSRRTRFARIVASCAAVLTLVACAMPQREPRFHAYIFRDGAWRRYIGGIRADERVLVLAHGVLETIGSAFVPSTVERIRRRGGYDDVLGVQYDWSSRVADVAVPYADFLGTLPARRFDVEAHSYGTLVTMAALERSGRAPQNAVFLGAPLDGTPLAGETALTSTLLELPGPLWNGNVGRFAHMRADGAAADLLPGSRVLRDVVPRFVTFAEQHRVHVILVAGTDRFGAGLLANLYLWTFGLECRSCRTPNDGVIPVASALGERGLSHFAATTDARIFSVRHPDLKSDPAVIDYVAKRLRRR